MAEVSPMMQNYLNTKEQYKDCLLFYRLGDFYEMFFDDAIVASRELEITLTGRACGLEEKAPMCGVPYHAVDIYLSRLIAKGYKVAICEQLEDPKTAKGIVKRDVIRVVTPGTVIETNMLEEKKNNYIMSIFKKGMYYGIAVCDISTGDFYTTEIKLQDNNFEKLLDEYARYSPAELVVNTQMGNSEKELNIMKDRNNTFVTTRDDSIFESDFSKIAELYTIVDNYDKEKEVDSELIARATNGLLNYFTETQKVKLEHINKIQVYEVQKYMSLDINARRSLELTERMRDKSKRGTLIWVLDKTNTSMGGRLLRRWINDPLLDVKEINERLEAVEELKNNIMFRGDIVDSLRKVYDMERLAGKISYGNANGRDLISLKNSLENLPTLKSVLSNATSALLKRMYEKLDALEDMYKLIDESIVDEPPISVKEGGLIKPGFNKEIDEYKLASTEGKNWIVQLEAKERELTGIKNLKVGYTKVFGYYIEVTKSFIKDVPTDRYIRKQTLTGAERYITEELKSMEDRILGAEEKVVSMEYEIFTQIRNEIGRNIERIQTSSSTIATVDVLSSLAIVAEDNNYVRPEVNEGTTIDIKDGRHPVIEKMLGSGEFVENDTYLNSDDVRVAIITGPNMAGKSTYMRQVAIITLMAQIGSFVPASEAKIGIVDKIFTRVGASDDLSSGQSTFMVEMNEVANILKDATPRSLVILDEIGRGTSTYDGLSIAWAVAEYIADKSKIGCKTLFATHYHELLQLEGTVEGIKNYQVEVKEKGEDVIFLRKIIEGGTDESYGIHVAKLAGVPRNVVTRANKVLRSLEKGGVKVKEDKENKKQVAGQFDLFNMKNEDIIHELDKINVNELTPIDALNTLVKIKEMLK